MADLTGCTNGTYTNYNIYKHESYLNIYKHEPYPTTYINMNIMDLIDPNVKNKTINLLKDKM